MTCGGSSLRDVACERDGQDSAQSLQCIVVDAVLKKLGSMPVLPSHPRLCSGVTAQSTTDRFFCKVAMSRGGLRASGPVFSAERMDAMAEALQRQSVFG